MMRWLTAAVDDRFSEVVDRLELLLLAAHSARLTCILLGHKAQMKEHAALRLELI